jgi:protein-S-isoprenylcysteine O-methyltransferase Ste14
VWKIVGFVYGMIAYLVFFATFLYTIGFLGELVVPKAINTGTPGPLGKALLIDGALLGLFAIQHSVMARQGFKMLWAKIVPAAVERSTYVLFSSLILILLFWQWRPIPTVVWDVQNQIGQYFLLGLFWAGWVLVLISTFLIHHFDLFGVRQSILLRGKEYTPIPFLTPAFYTFCRHPLMMGLIVAFWATPRMTAGHLLFAIASTAYILVGIQFEERDLVSVYGDEYREYKKRTSMLVPLPPRQPR